ncbi:hypothetical protein K474DRAFT_941696 [Panus rudis PR-1116 ss-1]|nr:hypothetical protein K474DRAFT_941696 [Panus rudis PR-1116 ss-1]
MTATIAPTRASFIVYKDEASTSTASSDKLKAPAASPLTSLANRTNRITIPSANDKENVDPLTGLRPSIEAKLAKKRKTGVLATKIIIRPSKESQPETKKRRTHDPRRRARELSQGTAQGRPSGERKPRKANRDKVAGPSRIRAVPELPPLEEEDFAQTSADLAEQERVAQAIIDSRCYDLTVLPLADVSEAYSQTPATNDEIIAAAEQLKELLYEDEETASVEHQEAAASETLSRPPTPESADETSAPRASPTNASFSTPERMRIYSAFTFSSPSLAGRRYAVTRGTTTSQSSQFSDVEFPF